MQSSRSGIQSDVKLHRAVSERYCTIKKLLQSKAKKRLAIASRSLRKEMVKSPEPTDLYKTARAQVNKQFAGLSRAQLDLLSFYLLADVVQYARNLLDRRKEKDVLDSLSEQGQEQQLRMQLIMERMTKADSAASNLLKKLSEVTSQIIAN